MNRLLLGTITACLVAGGVLQSPLLRHRADAHEPPATAAHHLGDSPTDAPLLHARSWRGLSLLVPAAWQQVANTDDHATWANASFSQTVTIGAALDPHRDVTEAARAAAPAIAASAPNGRVTEVARLSGTAATVRVAAVRTAGAGAGAQGLNLEQSWTRIPQADLIAIVSWTDTTGAWPRWARTELPHVQG